MRIKYARKRLFFVMYRSLQARNQEGSKPPLEKFFVPKGKICWMYFKTIGHSLKKLSPLRKLFAPLMWCHKLVKSLEVQQTFSFYFSLLQPDQIPEYFYVNNCGFRARATVSACYRNW